MQTFKPFETSGEWRFADPDTSYLHTGRSKGELVAAIVNYRAQNGLPLIERLDLVIDNYLCGLPCNMGKCQETKLKRGLLQYLKGGIALLKNVAYKDSQMVTQEEADRRSEICKTCSCNVFPDKDVFIKWSDELATHSVGMRKVANYEELGNCSVCSCSLKSKTWFKGPFQLAASEKESMQSCNPKCWQIAGK